MTSSVENIKTILGDNIPVEVPTAKFHFSQLLSIAQKAASSETELTLVGLDNIDREEYSQLRYAAKGHLRIKFPE